MAFSLKEGSMQGTDLSIVYDPATFKMSGVRISVAGSTVNVPFGTAVWTGNIFLDIFRETVAKMLPLRGRPRV